MALFANFLTLFIALPNPVFGSITPSYALTKTDPSISTVAPNQFSSGVEWDEKTNEFIQKYQDLRQLHDSLLRNYEPLARSESGNLLPPSESRMDYKDRRYKKPSSNLMTHRRTTPTNIEKHKYDILSKLKRIDEKLKKIVPQDGTMRYEGKRVYTTDELKYVESRVKELKNGYDYIYLGDGKFVRVEEETCDLSGVFGKIRAFDEDGQTILYQTGCCFYNWNSFSPGESSLLEHIVWITACLPLKAAYDHFTEKTWKKFEAKFLDGLAGLC
ncbi:uncharacterized protein MELLADRAFT_58713 [Melampsora larici-populina 98AG31]|uniref:Secreted protein n=1 Tax=Melampsora larici-populina (strain 98AG31 / pathotype 3-4-7) TaxID=747676 RepID=F4R4J9_MELLP|nr:uncharacterized protein MELLADRAFT_58713 [Melampsora larici-populina 98AG31]EGG12988.1 secreted protein [Melampsora larici-populina 98AG31]